MKIEVKDKHELISNAFLRETDLALNLFINIDVGVEWIGTTSSLGVLGILLDREDKETNVYSSVMLIAETIEDRLKLKRLMFNLHEEDQLWFMLPVDEVHQK